MKFVIKMMLPLTLVIQVNAQAVIRFQDHITAHAQYLGDLILISKEQQALMKIPLDSHPKAGDRINKEQIMQWISHKMGSLDYQWKGKKTAQVQQITQTNGKELINKAQTTLENQLKKKYDSVELSVKGIIKDSEFPLSDFNVEFPDSYPPAKQICVRLKRGNHSTPIWFKVNAYQFVLVAQHPIKNRTQLQQRDFILKKRNIAGLKAKPLTKLPQSQWLKNSINKDHILTQSDVVDTPQIIRGQWVQVTVSNHGVSVVSKAIAQNDGYTGQAIRMKNPASNKYFIAKVTAPNQAEVSS